METLDHWGWHRMCIALAKLFDDTIDEGCLREADRACVMVARNGNAESEFCRPEVRDVPVFPELCFERLIFGDG